VRKKEAGVFLRALGDINNNNNQFQHSEKPLGMKLIEVKEICRL
jgi:hypothetical protein